MNYLHGGWWILISNDSTDADAYQMGVFARPQIPVSRLRRNSFDAYLAITGKATYKGSMSGLYFSSDNELGRLSGKVNLDVDFQTDILESYMSGTINSLKINNKDVTGTIDLGNIKLQGWSGVPRPYELEKPNQPIGLIDGIPYRGTRTGMFNSVPTGDS